MARIVNAEKLKEPGSCKVFSQDGKRYAFCKGAIGLLTERQMKIFKIDGIPAREKAKGVEKHWEKWAKMAKKCSEKVKHLERPIKGQKFRECISKERKKLGI